MDLGDNFSVVFYGINDLRVEQRPIPKPNDDEVLVKVGAVGICGTDLHLLSTGCVASYAIKKPMTIGHEAAGMIIKVGKNVTHLKPGDCVTIEPQRGCQKCSCCAVGRYNICANPKFSGLFRLDGSMTGYFVHTANFCHKLPANISQEEGALIEPFSTAIHACKRGKVCFGSVVLIMGAGPIGLLTAAAAKVYGATKVVVTDVLKWRLDKAKEMGADITLQVQADESDDIIVQKIISVLGCRPNISIDCVGIQSTIAVALKATISGGTVGLVGLSGEDVMDIPITSILLREVDIYGVFAYANDFPTAIEMVSTGKVDLKPLITHHYKIGDVLKAFDSLKTKEGNAIKVLIHPN
ncbi:hypothetical protein RI129_013071 [Pyrocoelia pectoralis]|uniref:Sorbitol dehydrogenase n=1 Tax=Pyrocoelia pectoralis TaxID=417401 RepID=A0AAN7V5A0_9COLE